MIMFRACTLFFQFRACRVPSIRRPSDRTCINESVYNYRPNSQPSPCYTITIELGKKPIWGRENPGRVCLINSVDYNPQHLHPRLLSIGDDSNDG